MDIIKWHFKIVLLIKMLNYDNCTFFYFGYVFVLKKYYLYITILKNVCII